MQVKQLIALLLQQDQDAVVLQHPIKGCQALPIEVVDATQGIYDPSEKDYYLIDHEEQNGNDTPVVVLSNLEHYTIHNKVAQLALTE